ncbi:MAG: hypothetical protein ATN31_11160 [Candidatus Epulonipiscioides saccharophilum]|nr:MAG: hypothetical protein ATN31_11160 [Epulopiscium sp. AS2M-Bin001]
MEIISKSYLLLSSRNTISYIAQNITSSGAKIDFVPLPGPSKSLTTNNVEEFFAHCATVGYPFNPEGNTTANEETFVDAKHGDFRLAPHSNAKNIGVPIEGITSSDKPDAGALEGDGRVLTAGSTLKIPTFKEIV